MKSIHQFTFFAYDSVIFQISDEISTAAATLAGFVLCAAFGGGRFVVDYGGHVHARDGVDGATVLRRHGFDGSGSAIVALKHEAGYSELRLRGFGSPAAAAAADVGVQFVRRLRCQPFLLRTDQEHRQLLFHFNS